MSRTIIATVLALASLAASGCKPTTPTTLTLCVSGMTCDSCRQSIEKALKETTGVTSATVRFPSGTTTVSYRRSETSRAALSGVVTRLGYKVLAGACPQRPTTSRPVPTKLPMAPCKVARTKPATSRPAKPLPKPESQPGAPR